MKKNKSQQLNFESAKINFKKMFLEMIALSLLKKKPMYSYELNCEIQQILEFNSSVPYLYPLVYRLKESGLIAEVNKTVSENNRIRIYYQTTELGYNYLQDLKLAFHETYDIVSRYLLEP